MSPVSPQWSQLELKVLAYDRYVFIHIFLKVYRRKIFFPHGIISSFMLFWAFFCCFMVYSFCCRSCFSDVFVIVFNVVIVVAGLSVFFLFFFCYHLLENDILLSSYWCLLLPNKFLDFSRVVVCVSRCFIA